MAATWVKGKLGGVVVEGGARWRRAMALNGSTVMMVEDSRASVEALQVWPGV